ncbi:hypothetical protein [Ensifer aridi]|uniref:hypothetical protein n=1 Tax=Ensifer aridi TaxID=1708715 RepID=UPI001AECEC40|nr:hypothetical protein [Ensifer aridi]
MVQEQYQAHPDARRAFREFGKVLNRLEVARACIPDEPLKVSAEFVPDNGDMISIGYLALPDAGDDGPDAFPFVDSQCLANLFRDVADMSGKYDDLPAPSRRYAFVDLPG